MHHGCLTWIFFCLLSSAVLSAPNNPCKAKDPCVFLGKDLGWQRYEELTPPEAPYKPVTDSWNKTDTTVMITLASFRDKLCPVTLFNLFTKATYPERVFVGVVQQNTATDVDCLDRYCELVNEHYKVTSCPFKYHVKMNRVDASEAKGPTWARALSSHLIEDEEFCMQMDSHMDFVPYWDVLMLQMWAKTENEYAVLSTYVADSSVLPTMMDPTKHGVNNINEVPHL